MRRPEIATSAQYLSFFLGDDEYALGILQVREIIEYDVVTRVPGTPPWIAGAFNLRGSVLPVVDLRMKLGLPPCSITRRTCIVVAEVEYQGDLIVLGLLVDSIGQVFDFGPGDLEPTPRFGTPVHCEYLTGLGRVGKKFVLLLDANRILDPREIAMADEVQRGDVEVQVDAAAPTSTGSEESLPQGAPDEPAS